MRELTPRATNRELKNAQTKSRAVGILYVLATIVMVALACLPLLASETNEFSLGVTAFYQPILDFFSGFNFTLAFLVSALYLLMLLGLFINVIKMLKKLKLLFSKGRISQIRYAPGRIYARVEDERNSWNDNRMAMMDIGKCFSRVFAKITITHFMIALFVGEGVSLELFGIATLAVGLLFHFLCGVLGAKVNVFVREVGEKKFFKHYNFNPYDNNVGYRKGITVSESSRVHEDTRENGITVFFFRNLIQVVFVIALMFIAHGMFALNEVVAQVLSGAMDAIMDNIIMVALQLGFLLFIAFAIRYAFGLIEYNDEGMHGVGIKRFRIISFFLMALSAGLLIVPVAMNGEAFLDHVPALIMAICSLFVFLLDFVMHPITEEEKAKRRKKDNFFSFKDKEFDYDN